MIDLDEHTITAEVLRRIADTPDRRLHGLLSSLVGHLHDFARETRLTEQEWTAGISFLTQTGQISNDVRQEMILLSDILGLSQLVVAQNHSRPRGATEQTIFGPFHVDDAPARASHGCDISGSRGGEPLLVAARVTDTSGAPVPDAVVDVWHADAEGFYDVQDSTWDAEAAELRAVFTTDENGRFSFRSIMPVSYPIPMDGPVGDLMRATGRHPMRPAHIHFMIRKAGFDTLVTHVFADGTPYLDSDAVFGVRSSCIGHFVRHSPGPAPDGSSVDTPFHMLDYTFVLTSP